MFFYFLIFSIIISLMGYFIHRFLHCKWTGALFRIHMEHHQKYSGNQMVNNRWSRDNLLFTLPVVMIMVIVSLIAWSLHASLSSILIFILLMFIYGAINDAIHSSFHIKNIFFQRLPWWRKLRTRHFSHHINPKHNFGILHFIWDKIFGTYL